MLVPLHLSKVAFGAAHLDELRECLRVREDEGACFLTTRYLPKRHEEIAGQGSLYWILKHQLVARSPILRFGDAEGGRVAIHIDPRLILIQSHPKRAHQGWRYLESPDAPSDLGGDAIGIGEMPIALIGRLTALALI